jgi:1-acyl-sn-glycerol-3-phosphate acyltransferase
MAGLAGRCLVAAGQLPVRRYRIDPGPVRYGLDLLRAGGLLGMFPEGSRGAGLTGPVRPGVGYFAVKTGAPVLPVAVLGSGRMVRTAARPPVRIRFGEPLTFPAAGGVVNRGRWLAAAESVRQALAELVADAAADLPPDRARSQTTMEA